MRSRGSSATLLHVELETTYTRPVINSFFAKYLLLRAAGFDPVLRHLLARLPVSNFYQTGTLTVGGVLSSDVGGGIVTYRRTARRGFVLVGGSREDLERALEVLDVALPYRSERYTVTRAAIVSVRLTGGRHWQTLLVNEPSTAHPPECPEGQVKVCHYTARGPLCACQPASWSGQPPRTLCVQTVYGTRTCNPPHPFPPRGWAGVHG